MKVGQASRPVKSERSSDLQLSFFGYAVSRPSSMEFTQEIRCNFRSPQQYLILSGILRPAYPMNAVGGTILV